MRVALYARVSTNDKGQDPEMQLRELREYCKRRDWKISSEYVDPGISGSKDSRPRLNELMLDANRRKFDAVVVWKFDRFARSTSHLLKALETFQSLKVEFVSLTEGIERIRAGVRNARAKGKKLGRPRAGVDPAKIASLILRARIATAISVQ
jgi:DNA invertase Pin-like site-specific DNA recombinase